MIGSLVITITSCAAIEKKTIVLKLDNNGHFSVFCCVYTFYLCKICNKFIVLFMENYQYASYLLNTFKNMYFLTLVGVLELYLHLTHF